MNMRALGLSEQICVKFLLKQAKQADLSRGQCRPHAGFKVTQGHSTGEIHRMHVVRSLLVHVAAPVLSSLLGHMCVQNVGSTIKWETVQILKWTKP